MELVIRKYNIYNDVTLKSMLMIEYTIGQKSKQKSALDEQQYILHLIMTIITN